MAQPPSSPIPAARAKVKTPWRNVLKLALIGLFAWALFWVGMIVWVGHGLAGEPPPTDEQIRTLFAKHRDSFHEIRDLLLARPDKFLGFDPGQIQNDYHRFVGSAESQSWEAAESQPQEMESWVPVSTDVMLSRLRMTQEVYSSLLALMKKTGALDVRLDRRYGDEVEIWLHSGGLFGRSKAIVFRDREPRETVLDTVDRAERGSGNWVNDAHSLLGESGWFIYCVY